MASSTPPTRLANLTQEAAFKLKRSREYVDTVGFGDRSEQCRDVCMASWFRQRGRPSPSRGVAR